jgi:hypothetical protein
MLPYACPVEIWLQVVTYKRCYSLGLVISGYTFTISSYSIFTTLWATHGGKGVNFWIDGKRRILILDHIYY